MWEWECVVSTLRRVSPGVPVPQGPAPSLCCEDVHRHVVRLCLLFVRGTACPVYGLSKLYEMASLFFVGKLSLKTISHADTCELRW